MRRPRRKEHKYSHMDFSAHRMLSVVVVAEESRHAAGRLRSAAVGTYVYLPFERVILRTTTSSDFATDARYLKMAKAIANRPRAARAAGMYSDAAERPSTTTAMGPMPVASRGQRNHVSAAKKTRQGYTAECFTQIGGRLFTQYVSHAVDGREDGHADPKREADGKLHNVEPGLLEKAVETARRGLVGAHAAAARVSPTWALLLETTNTAPLARAPCFVCPANLMKRYGYRYN